MTLDEVVKSLHSFRFAPAAYHQAYIYCLEAEGEIQQMLADNYNARAVVQQAIESEAKLKTTPDRLENRHDILNVQAKHPITQYRFNELRDIRQYLTAYLSMLSSRFPGGAFISKPMAYLVEDLCDLIAESKSVDDHVLNYVLSESKIDRNSIKTYFNDVVDHGRLLKSYCVPLPNPTGLLDNESGALRLTGNFGIDSKAIERTGHSLLPSDSSDQQ